MAQGDLKLFENFNDQLQNGEHDLEADTFKFALVSDTTIAADHADTDFATGFTEVSGTNYTAGGEALNLAVTTTDLSSVVDNAGTDPSWSQDPAGPADIRWGIIYNDSHASKAAVAFVDMRSSGGNAISLIAGDISYTFNGSGIYNCTIAN